MKILLSFTAETWKKGNHMSLSVKFLLVVVGLIWAAADFFVDFSNGEWWVILPLVGICIAGAFIYDAVRFLIKNSDDIVKMLNVMSNLLFILQVQSSKNRNSEKFAAFLKTLRLSPEEFKRQHTN